MSPYTCKRGWSRTARKILITMAGWSNIISCDSLVLTPHLDDLSFFKRKLFISSIWVWGHGERVILEQCYKDTEGVFRFGLIVVWRRPPSSVPVTSWEMMDRRLKNVGEVMFGYFQNFVSCVRSTCVWIYLQEIWFHRHSYIQIFKHEVILGHLYLFNDQWPMFECKHVKIFFICNSFLITKSLSGVTDKHVVMQWMVEYTPMATYHTSCKPNVFHWESNKWKHGQKKTLL